MVTTGERSTALYDCACQQLAEPIPRRLVWPPFAAALAALLVHTLWRDAQTITSGRQYTSVLLGLLGLYLLWTVGGVFFTAWRRRLFRHMPLAVVGIVLVTLYEIVTLKCNLLPLPFFPSPPKIVEGIITDASVLGLSLLYSLRLQALGYAIGVAIGLPTGLLMGWYAGVRYWVNPLVRILGPIPASALIPLAMVIFPTSFTASVFLLALATWFPVTVMTWSGVANVNKGYFDMARTLGARQGFLVLKVALPAAMPMVFVGLFMGMGATFVTLIVAEMLGVKAGLGWYIQWAQGWGDYYKVYAALIISAVLFSTLISVLFAVRDRVLVWQKGLIRW